MKYAVFHECNTNPLFQKNKWNLNIVYISVSIS